MRVLLLEDEQALNEIAVQQIQRLGHEVVSAVTIAQAEAILADPQAKIDCLIADHRLPDGPGVALCVTCKHRFPRMAIGVVSACLTRADRVFLEQRGIPYWSKPILYSQVMEKLGATRPPPPVARKPPPNAPVLDRPILTAEPAAAASWKLVDRLQTGAAEAEAGPSWPSAFEGKQRLNHANHLATRQPFTPTEEEPPAKKGFARRLFSPAGND